ncbi:hypothetical protein BDZ88DRAFT_418242 [Geranomyces variabilis]|nr:hypothetical protein BDZ88DRAFT_418242 [Geranomyces variabilis]KAJ3140590.1 hypothetical protein HDU90_007891 [Geranomyces variabilis]
MTFPDRPVYANYPDSLGDYIFLAAPPDGDQEAQFLAWLPDLYTRATILAADFEKQFGTGAGHTSKLPAEEASFSSLPDIEEAAGIITAADVEELDDIGGSGGSDAVERFVQGEQQEQCDGSGHVEGSIFESKPERMSGPLAADFELKSLTSILPQSPEDVNAEFDALERPLPNERQSSMDAMIDAMRENAIKMMLRDAETVSQTSSRSNGEELPARTEKAQGNSPSGASDREEASDAVEERSNTDAAVACPMPELPNSDSTEPDLQKLSAQTSPHVMTEPKTVATSLERPETSSESPSTSVPCQNSRAIPDQFSSIRYCHDSSVEPVSPYLQSVPTPLATTPTIVTPTAHHDSITHMQLDSSEKMEIPLKTPLLSDKPAVGPMSDVNASFPMEKSQGSVAVDLKDAPNTPIEPRTILMPARSSRDSSEYLMEENDQASVKVGSEEATVTLTERPPLAEHDSEDVGVSPLKRPPLFSSPGCGLRDSDDKPTADNGSEEMSITPSERAPRISSPGRGLRDWDVDIVVESSRASVEIESKNLTHATPLKRPLVFSLPTGESLSSSVSTKGKLSISASPSSPRTIPTSKWFGDTSLDDEMSTDSALLTSIEDQSFDLLADDPDFSPQGHPVVRSPASDDGSSLLGSVVPREEINGGGQRLFTSITNNDGYSTGEATLKPIKPQETLLQVSGSDVTQPQFAAMAGVKNEKQSACSGNLQGDLQPCALRGDTSPAKSMSLAESPAKETRLSENIPPTQSRIPAPSQSTSSPRRSFLPAPTASSSRLLRPRKERAKKLEEALRDIQEKKASLMALAEAAHAGEEAVSSTTTPSTTNDASLNTAADLLTMPEEAVEALVERNHAINMVRRCVLKEIAVRTMPAQSPTARLMQRMENRRRSNVPRVFTGGEGSSEDAGVANTAPGDEALAPVPSRIPSRLKWDEHLISVVEFDPHQKTAMLSSADEDYQVTNKRDVTPPASSHTIQVCQPMKSALRPVPVPYERVSSPELRQVEVPVWKLPPDPDEHAVGDAEIQIADPVEFLTSGLQGRGASRGAARGRGTRGRRGGTGRGRSPGRSSASSK